MTVVSPVILFAQSGKIHGIVKDESSNASLAGVSVAVLGGNQAASSDFEGDYHLELAPGTYTLVFTYVGYVSKEITDVRVETGRATNVDITLAPSSDQLEEVIVSVSARKNTEQSILNMQKKTSLYSLILTSDLSTFQNFSSSIIELKSGQ